MMLSIEIDYINIRMNLKKSTFRLLTSGYSISHQMEGRLIGLTGLLLVILVCGLIPKTTAYRGNVSIVNRKPEKNPLN